MLLPSTATPSTSHSPLAKRAPRFALSPRIHRNHPLNRPPAHLAERVVPREHDAVHLGTVVSFRGVIRALEGPNFSAILLGTEQRIFFGALSAKQFHHFRLRLACGTQFCALLLNVALEALELVFVPGRWQRRSSLH